MRAINADSINSIKLTPVHIFQNALAYMEIVNVNDCWNWYKHGEQSKVRLLSCIKPDLNQPVSISASFPSI